MSGNINDTNTNNIREEVNKLLLDLDELNDKNEILDEWESTLQNRYKNLSKTSNTLFQFIFKNYTKSNFDKESFKYTLDLMLNKISNIQKGDITQHDASVNIGEHLATKFIPQLKK